MIRAAIPSLIALLAILIPAAAAQAHALQPGYLEMRVAGPDEYAVLWKVPAVRGRPMAISVVLPETCSPRDPGKPRWDGVAYITRWTAACPGGLANATLRIVGLERTSTDVLARIEDGEGGAETLRLTPSEPEAVLLGRRSLRQIAGAYFRLGVDHILGGIDHLLFVAALLLLVSGWRRLVVLVRRRRKSPRRRLKRRKRSLWKWPRLRVGRSKRLGNRPPAWKRRKM